MPSTVQIEFLRLLTVVVFVCLNVDLIILASLQFLILMLMVVIPIKCELLFILLLLKGVACILLLKNFDKSPVRQVLGRMML